jgi:hypothetical protein
MKASELALCDQRSADFKGSSSFRDRRGYVRDALRT